ncbi:S-layer homology domain-containing protein [Fischerella sp. PCC 9605]|uniref:S-layer homology domain-containing protein n=1 Tax=Fischerella sp. PCC 9605 TaxID=1173024 RepID=UPI00047D6A32|nr:S-layer homology domain-containing protein [Fischerella sp. PCC 9605]
MRYKNNISSALFSKVFFTAACVAMVSPMASALAVSGVSTTVEQKPNNSTEQQLLLADDDIDDDDNDDDDDDDREANLPEPVKTAIWQDISQRTNMGVSALRIVKAEKITWSDGCLGLKGNGICSQALVPGWQVVVAGNRQMWVYRTDESGRLARLDEESTQIVSATMAKVQSVTQQTSSRSTMQRRTMTVQQRSTQISAANNVAVTSKKPGFTLAILQPSGNYSEVITRVSVKAKRGKGYLKERFLGDYKYKIKSKAKFVKGLKAGDRIVVRLYDLQNRFIGYSEFECMSANTMVNLILPANPTEYKVVRTVYGLDSNSDGTIDAGSTTYDYFTQLSGERVSFLSSSQPVKVNQFQVQSLSAVATNSVYPASFRQGEFALLRQSVNIASANLAAALKATPGSLVSVTEVSDDDTYDIAQLMMDYREVGVANGIQVKFDDVPANHWAREFIAELAALEIIEGFPDGSFRPDQMVTRAQFAAMINQAFEKVKVRSAIKFKDVSTAFWAYSAIREAYQMGFLRADDDEFKPNDSLSRLEALLGFAQGLNYNVSGSTETILAAYTDAAMIRSDVRSAIAALTERGIVVNYPDVQTINTDKVATRAEVCALLYKALVSTGEVVDISSQYAVRKTQQQAEMNQEAEVERRNYNQVESKEPRRHCNQGIGNGAEGCDPGNSRPHGGSNDEGGRMPGRK